MSDPIAVIPPRYLCTPEAARFLGLSYRTLEKHRSYGTGPTYLKLGGRVVYSIDDLLGPIGAPRNPHQTPGRGTVLPAKPQNGHRAAGPRAR